MAFDQNSASKIFGRPSRFNFIKLGVRLATATTLLALLSGCTTLFSDECSIAKQAKKSGGGIACSDARKHRAVLFSGDDYPRLWSGEDARDKPNVNAASLNQPPARSKQAAVAYFGTLRVSYPEEPAAEAQDITQLKEAGAANFDPNAQVSLNFDHAPMSYFLKQMLGGALGVNYIEPTKLPGEVTFRTEKPIPKRQILQIVRDILGRNGLGMIYLNGVYQIGSTAELAAIQSADKYGVETVTRIVPVKAGSASDVVSLARQLVTPDVSMAATAANDSVVVRASPANLDVAQNLIQTLVQDGAGQDKMIILRLSQASPDVIANQIMSFYQGRLGKQEDLTLVPLAQQQAILAGSHDQRLLDGLRVLVGQLDRVAKPQASLRIIQLTYLSASDIAKKLSDIFGGQASVPKKASKSNSQNSSANAGASPFGGLSNPSSNSISAPPEGVNSSSSGPNANAAPSNPTVPGSSVSEGSGNETAASSTSQGLAGTKGNIAAGTTTKPKFIADTRNNAIMVYSSYPLFQRVKEVVKAIDVPQAQVVIEATIADVTLNDQLEYGVQWYLSTHGLTVRSSNSNSFTDPGTAGGVATLGASFAGVSANALLTALQSVTKLKVISSPYLTVLNGKEARLVIGDRIPYTTTTQTSNSGGASTITNAITTLDTGVILDVTPKILSNNSVDLAIDQEVSQPLAGTSNGSVNPTIQTRSIKSDIMAQSGRTILLGGMIQESDDRTKNDTPVMESLPVLGNLFKTNADTGNRTELLVMITPRVVRRSAQLEDITRLLRNQLHVN